MTETVSHGIVDDVANPGRPVSRGRPAPEYDVPVVRDDGTAVDPGETGDLYVRGVPGLSLFAGYLHDAPATRAAVDNDGSLTTGDRVTVPDDGAIQFADRRKDALRIGGENAASRIERVALAVKGVRTPSPSAAPIRRLTRCPWCSY